VRTLKIKDLAGAICQVFENKVVICKVFINQELSGGMTCPVGRSSTRLDHGTQRQLATSARPAGVPAVQLRANSGAGPMFHVECSVHLELYVQCDKYNGSNCLDGRWAVP